MRVIGILLIATTVVNALSSTTTNIDNTDVSNNGVVGLDEVYQRRAGKLHDHPYVIVSYLNFVHMICSLLYISYSPIPYTYNLFILPHRP